MGVREGERQQGTIAISVCFPLISPGISTRTALAVRKSREDYPQSQKVGFQLTQREHRAGRGSSFHHFIFSCKMNPSHALPDLPHCRARHQTERFWRTLTCSTFKSSSLANSFFCAVVGYGLSTLSRIHRFKTLSFSKGEKKERKEKGKDLKKHKEDEEEEEENEDEE